MAIRKIKSSRGYQPQPGILQDGYQPQEAGINPIIPGYQPIYQPRYPHRSGKVQRPGIGA
jgi:hypothetical protein